MTGGPPPDNGSQDTSQGAGGGDSGTSGQTDTLQIIGQELANAFLPLLDAISDPDAFVAFLNELGWDVADIPLPIQGLLKPLQAIDGALQPIIAGQGTADQYDVLIKAVISLVKAIEALQTASFDEVALAAEQFATKFPDQVVQHLIIEYLSYYHPVIAYALRLLGLIRVSYISATGKRLSYFHQELVWADIPALFQDPVGVFHRAYGWGDPTFDGQSVLDNVRGLLLAFGVRAYREFVGVPLPTLLAGSGDPAGPLPQLRTVVPFFEWGADGATIGAGLSFTVLPTFGPVMPGLALLPYAEGSLGERFSLAQDVYFTITGALDLQGGLGIAVRPGQSPQVVLGFDDPKSGAEASGTLMLGLDVEGEGGNPTVLLGSATGSRLQIKQLAAAGGVYLNSKGDADFALELKLQDGEVVISLGNSDSFLQKLLGNSLNPRVDLTVGYSHQRGLYFSGGAGLETSVSLHTTIGPFTIDKLYLKLAAAGAGLGLEVSISGEGSIGPISAAVDRIGITAGLKFQSGNLGPLDFGIDFKPPTGLGIAIDAGPVTGGGYLYFDPPNGRYAGALELQIYEVSVSAIGLLDTKFPDGSSGFSFLIIISAKFDGIQLGYGFTLNGVGGLAGINRTMVVEALQAGVRNHTIDHILFPDDPVRDAPQIISDLRTVFPPAQGRYMFGPMVLLGWGVPTLIYIELGIILEVPEPIRLALLGQLIARLPDKDAPVVELHLDILGIIDFGQKLVSLDASLHDSRIAVFSILGDMAMRLLWGDQPSFAMSLGGLNPHYQPPPNFPKLKRLMIALGDGDDPRIDIQAYMAVTSNTVQFGALVELYVGVGDFNVYGGLGFDCLFIFSPFSFTADFVAGLALRQGTSVLAGIQVSGTLSGTTPWIVDGQASISILFFDTSVHVHDQFGDVRGDLLPPADPGPDLIKALADPNGWSTTLPAGATRVATIASPSGDKPVVLFDPVGGVAIHQKVVPLNRKITKYGNTTPLGPGLYKIDHVQVGGTPAPAPPKSVPDLFARAQFEDLTDDQKLSAPSFEAMDAGVLVADAALTQGPAMAKQLTYQTEIVDSAWESRRAQVHSPPLQHQLATVGHGAAARAASRATGLGRFAPPSGTQSGARLSDESFVIASTEDLGVRSDLCPPTVKGKAQATLAQHFAQHPEDRGKLQVVPTYELAEAA